MTNQSAMPVAVFNPWTQGRLRFVMAQDHADVAKIRANGWEIPRGIRMHIDEDGIVPVDQ